MRHHSFGITTAEYVLIFSLVGIVAIPSLMFLGNSLNVGLTDATSKGADGAKELNTLLDSKRWDDSSSSGHIALPGIKTASFDGSLPDSMNTNWLGADGSFILADGSTTTSAEGTTQLVSDLLAQLAVTGQLFDGTILNDDEKSALQKLANKLDELAKEQGQLLELDGHGDKPHEWEQVTEKNNDAVEILADEVSTAFDLNPAGYNQIKTLLGLVTHGTEQIKPADADPDDTADLIGTVSPDISDASVPGFTDSASAAIATGAY